MNGQIDSLTGGTVVDKVLPSYLDDQVTTTAPLSAIKRKREDSVISQVDAVLPACAQPDVSVQVNASAQIAADLPDQTSESESGEENEVDDAESEHEATESEHEDTESEEYDTDGSEEERFVDMNGKYLWEADQVITLNYLDFTKVEDCETMSRRDAEMFLATVLRQRAKCSKDSVGELLNKAKQDLKDPKPRSIVVYCLPDNSGGRWRYYNDTSIDLLPFLITQMSGDERVLADAVFSPGPDFGTGAAYPSFNTDIDTLVLRYERCGNSMREGKMYIDCITYAVQRIVAFLDDNLDHPGFKRIVVTYCPTMVDFRTPKFFGQFAGVRGLKKLTLETHDEAHRHDPDLHYRNDKEGTDIDNDFDNYHDRYRFAISFPYKDEPDTDLEDAEEDSE